VLNVKTLALLIVALAVTVVLQQLRIYALREDHASYVAQVAIERAKSAADALASQQKLQQQAEAENERAKHEIATLEAAAADARAAADGLRAQLRIIAGKLATQGATIAGERQATSGTIGVLAELLDESVRRNQVLAAEADQRGARGLSCERHYEAIR
jgi:uncharacterized protein YigA (DUF484 family)